MPTYQYACTDPDCANRFELVQAFTDPSASECPVCGQAVRKVYGSVGVVFKGSGFYRNDSRAGANGESKSGSSDSKSESKSDSKSESTKSESKSDAASGAKSSDSSTKASTKTESKPTASAGSSSSGSSSTAKSA